MYVSLCMYCMYEISDIIYIIKATYRLQLATDHS